MHSKSRSLIHYALMLLLVGVTALSSAFAQNEVTLTATEEGFEAPETLESGYTTFTLENELEVPYSVAIYRLAEGRTAEDVQATLDAVDQAFAEEDGDPVAAIQEFFAVAQFLSGPSVAPGEQGSVSVVLEPGSYALIGEAQGGPEEEGEPTEEAEAMARTIHEFEVTESDSPAQAPEADVTVDMGDYYFEMPEEISSGPQLWEVTNSGEELHLVLILKLQEGRTLEDVMTFFESFEGEPPFEDAGEISPNSPGTTVYATLDLEPGSYIVICPIPQHGGDEIGPPHAGLGMVHPLLVNGEGQTEGEDQAGGEDETDDEDETDEGN